MFEMPTVVNPFPGLRPFEIEENNLFFGRDGQSDELLARLRRNRLLAVVGTSGSGKSSLIRAGLLPALYGGLMGNAGSNWRIAIFRPGHDPIGNLAWSLGQEDVLGSGGQDSEVQNALIETTLRRSSLGLVDAVRQARLSAHDNLLVVVDQFEELFRFKEVRQEAASEDAATFVKLLIEASSQIEIPIYVVLTMRSDFLGDCAQFAGLPEAINQGQYLIPRMSRDERHAAITGPVAVGGGAITPPLVTRLLNDVGDNPDQLPILQHALMRTWDFCATHRRNGQTLGLDHYEAIGTMSEALSRHADEAFDELRDERSRVIAEKLFKRLTERGADNREIRRPTRLGEICAVAEANEDEVIAVIDVFRREGRSFLMPPAGVTLDGETVIDISHESLIRNWKRLQAWVDEEAQSARVYRRLAEAAVLHREGSEGLLQDPALQIALEWRDKIKPNAAWAGRYQTEFDESIAYLAKSSDARDVALAEIDRRRNSELERERREREQAELYAAAQARANRKLRLLMVALALLLVLATSAAAYAFVARRRAQTSEQAALLLRDKANSLLTRLTDSLKDATNAKEEANRQRDIARAARLTAEDNQKKAEGERKRADEAAQLAAMNAEKERRAKEGLKTALARAEAIKDAGRFFRKALSDIERAVSNEKTADAVDRLRNSPAKFESVQDNDGVAAAYLKLGGSTVPWMMDPRPEVTRAKEYWPKAIKYYRLENNHDEAGETLARLGDLYSEGDPDENVPKDPAAADRSYAEAYEQFSLRKPKELDGMITALRKRAHLYEELPDVPSKRKAIEQYELALSLQAKQPRWDIGGDRAALINLYRAVETTERAEALILKLAAGTPAQEGLRAELLIGLTQWHDPMDLAGMKYIEKGRLIYQQERDLQGEAELLLEVAGHLNSRGFRGRPTKHSTENRLMAIDYCQAALKLYERIGSTEGQIASWEVIRSLRDDLGQKQEAIEAVSHELDVVETEPKFKDDRENARIQLYLTLISRQTETNQLSPALATYRRLLKRYGWKDFNDAPKVLQQDLQTKIDLLNEALKKQQPQPQAMPPKP